ncbi:hypothetical protein ACFQ0T_16455 [Kitasatospora gansuensis]
MTYAQAQELAEDWINAGVPRSQQREVRVREFDLGFVCWAEPRTDAPSADPGSAPGPRLVIARDSGASTLWPALPVNEVVSRYETAYGSPVEPNPAGAAKPVQGAVEATSFLLSPPQWLKDAGEAAIAAEHARLGEPGSGDGPTLTKTTLPEPGAADTPAPFTVAAPQPTQPALPAPGAPDGPSAPPAMLTTPRPPAARPVTPRPCWHRRRLRQPDRRPVPRTRRPCWRPRACPGCTACPAGPSRRRRRHRSAHPVRRSRRRRATRPRRRPRRRWSCAVRRPRRPPRRSRAGPRARRHRPRPPSCAPRSPSPRRPYPARCRSPVRRRSVTATRTPPRWAPRPRPCPRRRCPRRSRRR